MSHNENTAGACVNLELAHGSTTGSGSVGCDTAEWRGSAHRPTVAELEDLLKANTEERPRIRVALPANAADDLRCLFFHGPTWDGNVPSKAGRDELVRMGLAARGNGWQWLTAAGVQACFDNGIHLEKEAREARERKRRSIATDLAHAVLGTIRGGGEG